MCMSILYVEAQIHTVLQSNVEVNTSLGRDTNVWRNIVSLGIAQ